MATRSATVQNAPPGPSGTLESGQRITLKPTLSLGASIFEFDYGGDDVFGGVAIRGGVVLGSIFELGVTGERWPDLRPYDGGWALQAEGSVYPLGRRRVAPYLLMHLGHFRATLPRSTIYAGGGVSGRTTGLALGLHARVLDPLGLRLEGLLRFDAGGGDNQLRGFVTYAPGVDRLAVPPAQVAAVVYGMARLSGPWRVIEPAYGLKLATRLNERDVAALTIALLHWQIPAPSPVLSPYLWDTRAVLVMPGWQRGKRERDFRWYFQAGPAMSLMIEGPDFGLRGGAHAEVGGSVRFGSLPGLTAGAGYVWIVRGGSEPAIPPTDERGFLVHAGIMF